MIVIGKILWNLGAKFENGQIRYNNSARRQYKASLNAPDSALIE